MDVRRLLPLLVLSSFALPAATADVRAILENRVTQTKKATGIVIGTIDASGRREIQATGPALNGDSVLEIGSITKVFTSLLLADMVERGEVTLDTPGAKLLPQGWEIPAGKEGRQITLLDLSQQISGLPRLPNNMKPADNANPYADYDAKLLREFLAAHTLRRQPGELYEYSNLAVGLLGYALAQKAGMGYEALLKKRVLDPLGMTSTSITLSADQKKRLAPGHDPGLAPVKNWDFLDTTAGAGALRSTANDMLKFLAAASGWTDTPLKAAFARMRSVSKATSQPDLSIQMGWHLWKRFGSEIVWHNGGTGGYRSFAGFVPSSKTAVVVLCDTSHGVDDIGRHLLVKEWPLDVFKARTVTRKGTRLFVQATGQGEGEAFAEKPGEFFTVNQVVLHQNGRDMKMERIP